MIDLLDRLSRGEIRPPRLETPSVNKTVERSGRLSKAWIDELVERHQASESAPALAVEFGVHRETIRALLKPRGLTSRPRRMIVLDEKESNDILVGFERLGSVRATAPSLGYSERVVSRTLDALGRE